MFQDKNILITGGTGSFGQSFLEYVFQNKIDFQNITLFSRDELKHYNLQQKYPASQFPNLRFMIGDVRDEERLRESVENQDIIIHAAAMKHVHICEQNPSECIKTNVGGTENLIQVSEDSKKPLQLILISSDKAVEPNNVYGKSKQTAEKLFLQAQKNSSQNQYSILRYGNVYGASGSLIPTLEKQKEKGVITITDPRMKRFFLKPEEAIQTVFYTLENQQGGEIVIPKCKEVSILELAKEIAPEAEIEIIGIREGEKLTEKLMTDEEAERSEIKGNYHIIK